MEHTRLSYSIIGAMEALSFCRQRIYDEINAGRLTTFTLGKRRRFISAKAIDQYIQEREAETKAPTRKKAG